MADETPEKPKRPRRRRKPASSEDVPATEARRASRAMRKPRPRARVPPSRIRPPRKRRWAMRWSPPLQLMSWSPPPLMRKLKTRPPTSCSRRRTRSTRTLTRRSPKPRSSPSPRAGDVVAGRRLLRRRHPRRLPRPAVGGPRDPNLPPPVVRAQAKYVRSSARKARLVCDHLRGKSVEEARAILATAPRAVARDWSKLLESAVANAENNHELRRRGPVRQGDQGR